MEPVKHLNRVIAFATLLATCACSPIQDRLNYRAEAMVGAEPLQLTYKLGKKQTPYDQLTVPKKYRKQYVGDVVSDSLSKCQAFVARLEVAETGTNTVLDIASTTLSALATAFTPVTTIHALTAAATITTGTRATIDTDVFARNTAPMIIQEVNSTYYKSMASYVQGLAAKKNKDIVVPLEIAQIQTIHNDCTLAMGLTNLKGSQKAVIPISLNDLKKNTKFLTASGTVYLLESKATALSGSLKLETMAPEETTFSAQSQMTAQEFLNLLNANQARKF